MRAAEAFCGAAMGCGSHEITCPDLQGIAPCVKWQPGWFEHFFARETAVWCSLRQVPCHERKCEWFSVDSTRQTSYGTDSHSCVESLGRLACIQARRLQIMRLCLRTGAKQLVFTSSVCNQCVPQRMQWFAGAQERKAGSRTLWVQWRYPLRKCRKPSGELSLSQCATFLSWMTYLLEETFECFCLATCRLCNLTWHSAPLVAPWRCMGMCGWLGVSHARILRMLFLVPQVLVTGRSLFDVHCGCACPGDLTTHTLDDNWCSYWSLLLRFVCHLAAVSLSSGCGPSTCVKG